MSEPNAEKIISRIVAALETISKLNGFSFDFREVLRDDPRNEIVPPLIIVGNLPEELEAQGEHGCAYYISQLGVAIRAYLDVEPDDPIKLDRAYGLAKHDILRAVGSVDWNDLDAFPQSISASPFDDEAAPADAFWQGIGVDLTIENHLDVKGFDVVRWLKRG